MIKVNIRRGMNVGTGQRDERGRSGSGVGAGQEDESFMKASCGRIGIA